MVHPESRQVPTHLLPQGICDWSWMEQRLNVCLFLSSEECSRREGSCKPGQQSVLVASGPQTLHTLRGPATLHSFVPHMACHESSGSTRQQHCRQGNIYHQAVLDLQFEIFWRKQCWHVNYNPLTCVRFHYDRESIVAFSYVMNVEARNSHGRQYILCAQ